MSTSLRAVYTSPQDPPSRSFELQIVSPPPASSEPSPENAKAKVAYLSELRKLASTMQNDINVFLTAQMEEDKKAAEAQGRKISDKEAQEEANYGEEVVEEDA